MKVVFIQGSPFVVGSTSPKPLLVFTGTSVLVSTSMILVLPPMELAKVVDPSGALIVKSLDSSPSVPVKHARSGDPPEAHTTAAWALVTGELKAATKPIAAVASAADLKWVIFSSPVAKGYLYPPLNLLLAVLCAGHNPKVERLVQPRKPA
jgi:hypothetical protein